MSIGIYCLMFQDNEEVYIGQSINIEKRYLDHISYLKRTSINECDNYKLYNFYIKYGKPELHILEICKSFELDEKEIQYIVEFNSLHKGLNINSGGKGGFGPFSNGAKYSESQILEVLSLLSSNTILSCSDISKLTDVSTSTIAQIYNEVNHVWLKERYPEKYTKMLENKDARRLLGSLENGESKSAKTRGIIYPVIIDKEGVEYIVDNATKFARDHGLDQSALNKVLNGKIYQHKQYKLKNMGELSLKTSITYPALTNGSLVENNITNIAEFSRKHGLDPSCISKICKGKLINHKGWKLAS